MDYYPIAPEWAVGHQCIVCDVEIVEGERVMGDVDFATDTGASVRVAHVWCYRAVGQAKRDAFLEAARLARHNGAVEVAEGCNVRAFHIAQQLRLLDDVAPLEPPK